METESEDETEWTRQSLLEMGVAPAIRGSLVDDREPDPGNLTKKA